jgi:hypothetical protein
VRNWQDHDDREFVLLVRVCPDDDNDEYGKDGLSHDNKCSNTVKLRKKFSYRRHGDLCDVVRSRSTLKTQPAGRLLWQNPVNVEKRQSYKQFYRITLYQ